LVLRSKASKREFLFLFSFLYGSLRDLVNEPQGSIRIRKDYGFKTRKKALRGEPHGHFEYEIRLKESKSFEHQEGNQTLKMFLISEALLIHMEVL
jgi:hypothetical protein